MLKARKSNLLCAALIIVLMCLAPLHQQNALGDSGADMCTTDAGASTQTCSFVINDPGSSGSETSGDSDAGGAEDVEPADPECMPPITRDPIMEFFLSLRCTVAQSSDSGPAMTPVRAAQSAMTSLQLEGGVKWWKQ